MAGRPLLTALWLTLLAGCSVSTTDTSPSKGAAGQNAAGQSAAGQNAGGQGTAGQGTGGQAEAGKGGGAGSGVNEGCGEVPASGRCVSATTVERCLVGSTPAPGQPAETPRVVQATCPEGTTCQQKDTWSGCVPTSACTEGASYCDGTTTRVVCTGGAWQTSACAAGEQCTFALGGTACVNEQGQAGQSFTLHGKLLYEFRTAQPDTLSYGEPEPDAARGVIALAYDGDTFLGGVYTSGDDGSFAIELPQKPTATTTLYFVPMLYDEGGTPQFAVAIPSTTDINKLESTSYYSFSRQTGDKLDVGDLLITEAEGSPAIHIHQWVLYSILQLRQSLPAAKPFNLLALWAPGKQFPACGQGTCYAPRGYGATVDYGSGTDFYEGVLLLAGTDETPHQFSSSVILHEFGHYTMDAYSRSPNEAAQHSITMREPPGMAWSEGWATYLGQSMRQNPIYFDKQQGITWYYDISKPYSGVEPLDPQGPLDQQLSESQVSLMLWHLDDTGTEDWDKSSLGQNALLGAFGSKRLTSPQYNRGYPTVDLVDFLDGLRCQGAPADAITSITQHELFPYDNAPTCAP